MALAEQKSAQSVCEWKFSRECDKRIKHNKPLTGLLNKNIILYNAAPCISSAGDNGQFSDCPCSSQLVFIIAFVAEMDLQLCL